VRASKGAQQAKRRGADSVRTAAVRVRAASAVVPALRAKKAATKRAAKAR